MSNRANLRKTSEKGFVNGLKIFFHQYNFYQDIIDDILNAYDILKHQFKGQKEELIIYHGVLYGLYFFEIRKQFFINNKSSKIRKSDLKEINDWKHVFFDRKQSKDDFNLYIILAVLGYLINPAAKRIYVENNIIFLFAATIIEVVPLKTIQDYTSDKYLFELNAINERVKKYIAKNATFPGQLYNLFVTGYYRNSNSKYIGSFPTTPWLNERFFNNILKYKGSRK